MNPSPDFNWNELRVRKSRMRITWVASLLATSAMGCAAGQGVSRYVPASAACIELNQTVMTQIANGQVTDAELAVSDLKRGQEREVSGPSNSRQATPMQPLDTSWVV